MTVNELKNHLVPLTNIQSDFMILHRYISNNESEELDHPSKSLKDFNNNEKIHISISSHGQYCITIFLLEHLEQTQVSYLNNADKIKSKSIFYLLCL